MTTAQPIPRDLDVPDDVAELFRRVTGIRAQVDTGVDHSMRALASLAGWRTTPHSEDPAVVRLALKTAYARHDPDQGGHRDLYAVIGDIEDRWLELELARQATTGR